MEVNAEAHEERIQRFFGEYEVIKSIGKGKFAVVYRAKKIGSDDIVALKRISVDMIDDKAREKCLKEVRLLQSLDHPNIIHYLDSFITENDLVIIYEWAAAGDLKRQLRKAQERGVGFEERIIWKYFSQICNAMQHMYERRIMHRDLKPANIFLTLDGTIKVGDLGLSRELSEHTIQAHSKVGTPLYMSPEVLKGDGYDFKSDIWSLGCLLYELAMLKSPFKSEGLNLYSLFQKISNGEFQPLLDNYSEELRSLTYSMISTNPQDRPEIGTVCQIASDMRTLMTDRYNKQKKLLNKSSDNSTNEMMETHQNDGDYESKPSEGKLIHEGIAADSKFNGIDNQIGSNPVQIVDDDEDHPIKTESKPFQNAPMDSKLSSNFPMKSSNQVKPVKQGSDSIQNIDGFREVGAMNTDEKDTISKNQNALDERKENLRERIVDDEPVQKVEMKEERNEYKWDSNSKPYRNGSNPLQSFQNKIDISQPQKSQAVSKPSSIEVQNTITNQKSSKTVSGIKDINEVAVTSPKKSSMKSTIDVSYRRPKSGNTQNFMYNNTDYASVNKADQQKVQEKLQQSSTAMGIMEILYSKLIVLGIPSDLNHLLTSQKKDKPVKERPDRLLPFHFALDLQIFPQIAGCEKGYQFFQYKRMVQISIWLCQLIHPDIYGMVKKIDLEDDSPITTAKQLLRIIQLNPNELPEELQNVTPTSLMQGYGINVCYMLNFLADKALQSNYQLKPLRYPQVVEVELIPDENNVQDNDDIEEIDEDFVAINGGRTESDGLDVEESGGEMDALQESYMQVSLNHQTAGILQGEFIDPILWKAETERVAPILNIHREIRSNEWTDHLSTIQRYRNLSIFQTSTDAVGMKTVPTPIMNELNHLKHEIHQNLEKVVVSERILNAHESVVVGSKKYSQSHQELLKFQETSREFHEKLENLSAEYHKIDEKLEDMTEDLDIKANGHDHLSSNHVVQLKEAMKRIKSDIKELNMKLVINYHQLIAYRKEQMKDTIQLKYQKKMNRKKNGKQLNTSNDSYDENGLLNL